jgi:hypothetical protein
VRYQVNVPNDTGETKYQLGSAVTPSMAVPAGIYRGPVPVEGYPGTLAISAPSPSGIPQDVTAGMYAGVSRSIDAPNRIFPGLYRLAFRGNNHAPVARVSDNQMPVPALSPSNVIKSSPYVTRKGGQRQVFQPQVVQRWLGMKGTPNG